MFDRVLRLILLAGCLSLGSASAYSQESLVGTWSLVGVSPTELSERREMVITFAADGQATLTTCLNRILFVETTEGECIARPFRDQEQNLTGTYELVTGRIVFHWNGSSPPADYFIERSANHVWPYRLKEDLRVHLSDRTLSLKRHE